MINKTFSQNRPSSSPAERRLTERKDLVIHYMKHPVNACFPAVLQGFVKFCKKVRVRFFVCHVGHECLLKVLDIANTRNFLNARIHHHHKECYEELAVLAKNLEGPLTKHLKPKMITERN